MAGLKVSMVSSWKLLISTISSVRLPAAQHIIDEGLADVAADKDIARGRAEKTAEKRGGGRLAVRAGNGDDRFLYEALMRARSLR